MDEKEIGKKLDEIGKPYSLTAKDLRQEFDVCKEESKATDLVALGMVRKRLQDTLGFPEMETPAEKPAAEAPAKTELDADDFLKRAASGNWLTAGMVNEGDRLVLLEGIREDAETFERPYIIAPVKLGDEEYDLRLGVRNVKRLRESFGADMSKWVGREVEIAAIQSYKLRGAEQKGLILRAVKSG